MTKGKLPGDPGNRTREGYIVPNRPIEVDEFDVATEIVRPRSPDPAPGYDDPSAPPVASASKPVGPPPIEVEYIREPDGSSVPSGPVTLLEIWTRNRIYHCDVKMICIAVVDRATGRTDPQHPLFGARLTGGERSSKVSQAVELVYPLPVPGTEAVFRQEGSRRGQFGKTSVIERIVMRISKVRVGAKETEPSWEELTGRFRLR